MSVHRFCYHFTLCIAFTSITFLTQYSSSLSNPPIAFISNTFLTQYSTSLSNPPLGKILSAWVISRFGRPGFTWLWGTGCWSITGTLGVRLWRIGRLFRT
uniref:Uncharacterized protein n=1 Tax=Cacopsylla melanoneura TaxID=428564 RepID=A0A8D8T771_9HEMI